jgi:hypothetical protein
MQGKLYIFGNGAAAVSGLKKKMIEAQSTRESAQQRAQEQAHFIGRLVVVKLVCQVRLVIKLRLLRRFSAATFHPKSPQHLLPP